MELRHLRSFVVLAEEQHFGRAAERLHVAQPALSQQLKVLEKALGTRLFERSSRRVELTEGGLLLQARAKDLLAAADRAVADLALLEAGRAGRVRVGFVGTATYDLLPRVTRRVREELPDIELDVHGELLGPDLIDRLRGGELDLAVVRATASDLSDIEGVEAILLRQEPLVAALPTTHPHAGAQTVGLRDLAGDVLITHPAGRRSTMQPVVTKAFRDAGLDPEVLEVGETGTLVVFVAAGLGVGLVPASVRALKLDGVAYVPLAERVIIPLALAHRPGAGPAVRSTVRLVLEETA